MKKKTVTAETFIAPNVKLTREDLEEILDTFKTHFENVTIEDEKAVYDSFEDLEHHRGKRVEHLIIIGSSPYSVFVINHPKNKRARIETANVEAWAQGYYAIRDLLAKRKRFTFDLAREFGIILFSLLLALIIASTAEHKIPTLLGVGLSFFLLLVTLIIASQIYFGYFNFVTLDKRHELQGFWSRNKDKIVILLIGATIGFFFTCLPNLITWFKGQ